MVEVTPDPKPISEGGIGRRKARARRTRWDEWAAMHTKKGGPCRLCGATNYQLHHLLSRARGGPHVSWNLVPLCPGCHGKITREDAAAKYALAAALTDDEYAGLIGHEGEGAIERIFGPGTPQAALPPLQDSTEEVSEPVDGNTLVTNGMAGCSAEASAGNHPVSTAEAAPTGSLASPADSTEEQP